MDWRYIFCSFISSIFMLTQFLSKNKSVRLFRAGKRISPFSITHDVLEVSGCLFALAIHFFLYNCTQPRRPGGDSGGEKISSKKLKNFARSPWELTLTGPVPNDPGRSDFSLCPRGSSLRSWVFLRRFFFFFFFFFDPTICPLDSEDGLHFDNLVPRAFPIIVVNYEEGKNLETRFNSTFQGM